MVNVEDVDHAVVLVDPVDDAVIAAPGAMTSGERPEQWRRTRLASSERRALASDNGTGAP
jgi:hypothetical protein